MGTWNSSLFGDDVALDLREEFLDLLRDRVDPDRATRIMEERNQGVLGDPDEQPLFWMALAATQWEYGVLSDHVRDRALEVIADGADLHRWTDADVRRRRAATCEALAAKLRSPQPRRRTPRPRKQVFVPSRTVIAPDGMAKATVFSFPEEPHRMQVLVELDGGGGGVCAGNASHEAIDLVWVENRTLEIGHPATMTFEKRDSSLFYLGKIVTLLYRPIPDA